MALNQRAKIYVSVLIIGTLLTASAFVACDNHSSPSSARVQSSAYQLTLELTRTSNAAHSPFRADVSLKKDGTPLAGQTLSLVVPKGGLSAVTDNDDGTYSFIVTPSATGTYPVTVSFADATIGRIAVVFHSVMTGAKQAMAVPGDFINTDGDEDGITITPDGEYLFLQYGPWYFSAYNGVATICSSGAYSSGYDLNNCHARTDSHLVFNTIGPYNNSLRPRFPMGAFNGDGTLRHVPGLILPGQFNGMVGFPTVLYGFKRQSDGTFAEPFKVAFDDARSLQGPGGLSFQMNGDGTAKFVLSYNDYFNPLGEDGQDIYYGTLTLGQDKNLGSVTYSGDTYASITPNITPMPFASLVGNQGNPYLYYDSGGTIRSIWTDDEYITHNLSVFRLTAGTYPNGTWVRDTLPSDINTAGDERQPTFVGNKLFFTRDYKIVYHTYTPTNGACASTFTHNDCWGPEVVVVASNLSATVGEIYGVGEPTIATYNGKTYLYFVYVESRASLSIVDFDMAAGFIEIP